jgi:hypothetical protein
MAVISEQRRGLDSAGEGDIIWKAIILKILICTTLHAVKSIAPQSMWLYQSLLISIQPLILNCGQVYIRVRRHADSPPEELEGYVVVTKNPCLHPGDVLVLKVSGWKKIRELVGGVLFVANYVFAPVASAHVASDSHCRSVQSARPGQPGHIPSRRIKVMR